MRWWPFPSRPKRRPPATYGSFRREVRHRWRRKVRVPARIGVVMHPRHRLLTIGEVLARQVRRAA